MSRAEEDRRVEAVIQETEAQLEFLKDDTPSLVYRSAQLQLEILKELRWQRRSRNRQQ